MPTSRRIASIWLDVAGELDAVDDDLPLLVRLEPVDAADHGRFARARGPAHDDALAALDREAHILQRMVVAVPFMDVAQFDHGCRVVHRRPRLNFASSEPL